MDKCLEIKRILKAFFDRDWTKEEKVLLLADCLLLGVVIGAIWSPKKAKNSVFGSYNTGDSYKNPQVQDEEE